MTATAVGACSAKAEQARFIRALAISLLLHACLLPLKFGPTAGRSAATLPGGGVIEAVLRRAPVAQPQAEATAASESVVQSPAVVAISDTRKAPETSSEPTRAETSASPQPAQTRDAPATRSEGSSTMPGGAASGASQDAIPLLPPIAPGEREPPRRPMLLAPLNFSFPPDTRLQNGRIRVRILLDNKGEIEEMRVVAAAPPGVFDHAAIQVLRKGRYAPGYAGPVAVRSYLYMELTFGPGALGQQLWYAGSAFAPPDYNRR
jgi:protein TonB